MFSHEHRFMQSFFPLSAVHPIKWCVFQEIIYWIAFDKKQTKSVLLQSFDIHGFAFLVFRMVLSVNNNSLCYIKDGDVGG